MKHLLLLATLAACTRNPDAAEPRAEPELTARRAQMLAWLDDYTARGEIPTDDSGLPLSVFKDSHGVRCPMAELMYRSGHGDLVDAIAAENNHLQLADVHDGPVLDWMLGSGLTRDEIVMIQGIPRDMILEIRLELQKPEEKRETILAQRARVRGRLEMAQVALRKDMRSSVRQAAASLPGRHIPAVRTQRPVLARD